MNRRLQLAVFLTLGVVVTGWSGAAASGGPVVILGGGDVTLGYHLPEYLDELRGRGVGERERQTYPFRHLAEVTRAADIFWVNLEGTLTRHRVPVEKSFNFRADPRDVSFLLEAGVDVACLANNHAFDYGAEGLQETRATLAGAGIVTFGAGENLAEARRPAVVHRRGLDVGFLGYLFLGTHSIEPESIYAGPDRPGAAGTHADEETLARWIDEDVRALREQVDVVLVSFHWGWEGSHLVAPYQRRLARRAADAGADVIVGHHPHALQGAERLGKTFVAYSLGNLMFAGNWNPRFKDAALLQNVITFDETGVSDIASRFLPIGVDRMPDHPFQPWFRSDEDAARVHALIACYARARTPDDCAFAGPPWPVPAEDAP